MSTQAAEPHLPSAREATDHIDLGDPVAYRVRCPSCGEFAQLRVVGRPGHRPEIIAFSCRNQTERTHELPSEQDLQALIPE